MSMQDTISDMLTRIRNGQRAKLKNVSFPSTKFKLGLIKLFLEEGYILAYKVTEDLKPQLIVELKYFNDEPVIQSITRVSKPGLRIYRNCKTLPSVLGGLGIAIISTSKGLMTDKKARLNRVGGEVICYIS